LVAANEKIKNGIPIQLIKNHHSFSLDFDLKT